MYFFDLEGLIKRLSTTPLKNSETLEYFFAFIVLRGTTELLGSLVGKEKVEGGLMPMLIGIPFLLIYLAIAWAVLRRFFNASGGDEGKDFLPNLVVVGWVVSWRMMVITLPVVGIALAVIKFTDNKTYVIVAAVAVIIVLIGCLFWGIELMSDALRRIRTERTDR